MKPKKTSSASKKKSVAAPSRPKSESSKSLLRGEGSPVVAAAKPKGKTKRLEIPPILLEGDAPQPQTLQGPGQKFALGPRPAEQLPPLEESGELPEAYGTRTLLLTARDPHWLYAHWDLTREQLKEYNGLSRDRHLILRVFVDAVRGEPFSEVHVHPESKNWFIHVGRGGTRFVAELGYYTRGGQWCSISISGATLTPPDQLAEDLTVRFETIPIDIPFEELLRLVKRAARDHLPLAQAIQELRDTGYSELPDPGALEQEAWTPEQERALEQLITMDRVRRVWMGSLEITELLRRQMLGELSSAAAAGFAIPSSWSGAVSSFSSPSGVFERMRGFWFNVNAELIIYGATDPQARVTIGGRTIRLRPDGSFSYRFSLPDGNYELPAVAISPDGEEARSAQLEFSRHTEFQGHVEAHPQDPQLRPPHPAHVA